MKRTTIICRILVLLFFIAEVSTGMYTLNMELDSFFSYSDTAYTLSKASGYLHRMDTGEEIFGIETGEATANMASGTMDTLSAKIISFIFLISSAVLPFILLFLWNNLDILQRSEFIDRMYLILFIHNSDGKKGNRTSILRA